MFFAISNSYPIYVKLLTNNSFSNFSSFMEYFPNISLKKLQLNNIVAMPINLILPKQIKTQV